MAVKLKAKLVNQEELMKQAATINTELNLNSDVEIKVEKNKNMEDKQMILNNINEEILDEILVEEVNESVNIMVDTLEKEEFEEDDMFDDEELDDVDEIKAEQDLITKTTQEDMKENIDNIENAEEPKAIIKETKLDFSSIILAASQSSSRGFGKAGYLTLVDGGKCGQSIAVSSEVYTKLKLTETVQVAFTTDSILLGKCIPDQTIDFKLKRNGAKHMIYSAALVRETTKQLGLVFGDNKTCVTFYKVAYDESLDSVIAIISK